MKNVVYDRVSRVIRDYDREPLPFELEIKIPYQINLQKTIEEHTGNMVQKVNEQGELLYRSGEVETTEFRVITEFELETHNYRVCTDETITETIIDENENPSEVEVPVYNTITSISQVPVSWGYNDPIMIEEVVSRTYTLEQNCSIFTADEVIEAITNTTPTKGELETLKIQLADQNQTQSDFMDYVFTSFPEIS